MSAERQCELFASWGWTDERGSHVPPFDYDTSSLEDLALMVGILELVIEEFTRQREAALEERQRRYDDLVREVDT